MHGVHPSANAIPSGSAPAGPGRTFDRNGRRSAYSEGDPTRSAYRIIATPNNRTNAPAIRSRPSEWSVLFSQPVGACPTATPKAVNTIANPETNSTIGMMGTRGRTGAAALTATPPSPSGNTSTPPDIPRAGVEDEAGREAALDDGTELGATFDDGSGLEGPVDGEVAVEDDPFGEDAPSVAPVALPSSVSSVPATNAR